MNLYFNPLTAQFEFSEKTRWFYGGMPEAPINDITYARRNGLWIGFIDANGVVVVPSFERHIQIAATPSGNAAAQADTVTIGTATGLQFSSSVDNYSGCQWEIPDDWAGDNIKIELDWMPDSGATSGTDTVEFIVEYRSITVGEAINNGTAATVTVTDSGDYARYTTIHASFTIPFDDANQPLMKQDHIYFLIHRNTLVANDFTGTVTITAYEIVYNSVSIPTSN